jgi:hypothetical protein
MGDVVEGVTDQSTLQDIAQALSGVWRGEMDCHVS